jgi:hypothetical protein
MRRTVLDEEAVAVTRNGELTVAPSPGDEMVTVPANAAADNIPTQTAVRKDCKNIMDTLR